MSRVFRKATSAALVFIFLLTLLPVQALAVSGETDEVAALDADSFEAMENEAFQYNGDDPPYEDSAEVPQVNAEEEICPEYVEDAVLAADDGEIEIVPPGIDISEDDTFDGDYEGALFDGVPEYSPEGDAFIEVEDAGAMDGASGMDGAELIDSFYEAMESSEDITETPANDHLDGGVIADSVGDSMDGENEEMLVSVTGEGQALNAVDPAVIGNLENDPNAPANDSDDLDGGFAPSGYYMEISSTKCTSGSSITFYTRFSNTTTAYLAVFNRGNGKIAWFQIKGSTRYRLNFDTAGNYALYLRLYNRYGSYDGWEHNQILYVSVGQAPRPYYMSISARKIIVGQTVSLKIDRKNASQARLIIKETSSGKTVYSNTVGNTFSCQIKSEGRYSFHLVTKNDYGTYDGSQHQGMTLYCTVDKGAPTAYSWSLNGSSRIDRNGSTKIQVNNLGGATQATVVVEQSGKIVAQGNITGPTGICFSPSGRTGTFLLYLITKNSHGTYNGRNHGQTIQITSTGSASDYWMQISKTSCYVGDKITFSIDPRDSQYFYFVIEKDGSIYYKKNHGLAHGISFTPNKSGTYRFYLITYNEWGSFNGGSQKGYSLTCRVSEQQRTFSVTTDGYQFSNSAPALGYNFDVDKISADSYKAVFGSVKGSWLWLFSQTWGGSCFGFASTAGWAYEHPSAYFSSRYGGSTVYSITAPRNRDSSVTRMLERYQIAQSLDTVSTESNRHENDVRGLVSAVEAFEEGGRAVILRIYREGGGHAIVPLEHYTSGLTHCFRVYDCNTPREVGIMRIWTNSDGTFNSMYYCSGSDCPVYNKSFDFCYADTVYDAMPAPSRQAMDGNGDPGDLLVTLSVSSDAVTCSTDGHSVDLSQYEVRLCDSNVDGSIYYFPSGSYTLTCSASDAQKFSCSVADDSTCASASAVGSRVTFYIGSSDGGSVKCSAWSDSEGMMDMTLLNERGQLSYLNTTASYLGVALDGEAMQMASDSQTIERNGEVVSLIWSGSGEDDFDGADNSASAEADAFDAANATRFSAVGKSSHLSYGKDGIVGTLILSTENQDQLAEYPVYVVCYDSDGRMVGMEQTSVVIGSGQGAAAISLEGEIQLTSVQPGGLKMKVLFLDDTFRPLCAEAVFDGVTVEA